MRRLAFLVCSLLLLGLAACNSATSTDAKPDEKGAKHQPNDPARPAVEIKDVKPGGKLFTITTRSAADFQAKTLVLYAFGSGGEYRPVLPDPAALNPKRDHKGMVVGEGATGEGYQIISGAIPATIHPPLVENRGYKGPLQVLVRIYVDDGGKWAPRTEVFEKTIQIK
jgi:hypothetical protein